MRLRDWFDFGCMAPQFQKWSIAYSDCRRLIMKSQQSFKILNFAD